MVKQAMEHPRTWEPDSADAKKSEEELIVDFLQRCAWQRAATRDYNCKGLQNYASDLCFTNLAVECRVTHVRSQRGKVRTDGLYKQSAVLHWCSQESDGTYKTRRLRAGPGVAGSVAESRASGGRLRSRSGGPEAKLGRWKTLDLSATLINSWPSSVEGFFHCLAYP